MTTLSPKTPDKIVLAVTLEARTAAEIAAIVGISEQVAYKCYLRLFRDHRIYVKSWMDSPTGGRMIPVCLAGDQPNAPQPDPRVLRERRRIRREQLRAEEERARAARMPAIRRDPMVAAFYGPYRGKPKSNQGRAAQ